MPAACVSISNAPSMVIGKDPEKPPNSVSMLNLPCTMAHGGSGVTLMPPDVVVGPHVQSDNQ